MRQVGDAQSDQIAEQKKKKIISFGQPTSLIARGRASWGALEFIYVKLNVKDLQIETPCQHHMPQLFRLGNIAQRPKQKQSPNPNTTSAREKEGKPFGPSGYL